jgi:hypothetical protein
MGRVLAAGLAPQTVRFIENGFTRQQNHETIAHVLGIPPVWLGVLATGLAAATVIMPGPGPGHGGGARWNTTGGGQAMKWVTRSGVRMDRAAMIWLIRTRLDPGAEIAILPEAEVLDYAQETGATPFHHPKADLRNTGVRTGFDALRTHYDLQDPALGLLSLIIRGAETNDKNLTQWSPGFSAIGNGLRNLTGDDDAFVANMAIILDGLYRFCQDQLAPVAKPSAPRAE